MLYQLFQIHGLTTTTVSNKFIIKYYFFRNLYILSHNNDLIIYVRIY